MPSSRQKDPADEAAVARALDAARSGQGVGFEWLWHRFSRHVTAFARFRGSEDPEGIANDTFAAAFGQIASFRGDSNGFVSFVFSIARNKLIDEQRKRRRRVVTAAFDGNTFDRDAVDSGRSVDSAEAEALAGLTPETATALQRLTDEQREIVFLRLVADMSLEDVAELTGRSIGAVKAMQHRALASMRREISAEAVSP